MDGCLTMVWFDQMDGWTRMLAASTIRGPTTIVTNLNLCNIFYTKYYHSRFIMQNAKTGQKSQNTTRRQIVTNAKKRVQFGNASRLVYGYSLQCCCHIDYESVGVAFYSYSSTPCIS